MKDPLSIAGDAYERALGGLTYSERQRADKRMRAVIRGLEAAGFRIVHPDQLTDAMTQAAFDTIVSVFQNEGCEPNSADWRGAIAAAIRAAQRYGEAQ